MEKEIIKAHLDFYSTFSSTKEITTPKCEHITFSNDIAEGLLRELLNRSLDKAEWLPEYNSIVSWLQDNKSKGLMLYGSNGRGKTVMCTRILPVIINIFFGELLWEEKKGDYIQQWERRHVEGTEDEFLSSAKKWLLEDFIKCNNLPRHEQVKALKYFGQKVFELKEYLYGDRGVMAEGNYYCQHSKVIIFDDIGAEPDECVMFGEKHRLFAEAVDYCEKHGVLLIFSTNLTPEEIKKRYGYRVYDRLRSLVKPICFKGDSLRK